jgi:RNA polymerase sigma-70 factor (ECF subfamily)
MSKSKSPGSGAIEQTGATSRTSVGNDRTLELVARCKAGDQAAFRQLFDDHVAGVHRHLSFLLGPEPDVDDLVQLVFLNVFDAISDFRGNASFSTWLFRITINVANQEMRQRGRRRRLNLALTQAGYVGPSSTHHTPELRMHVEQQIYEVLDQLPVKKRETYILYMYEGYSLEEIADLLGASVSTIGSRLHAARKEIVKLLARRRS